MSEPNDGNKEPDEGCTEDRALITEPSQPPPAKWTPTPDLIEQEEE